MSRRTNKDGSPRKIRRDDRLKGLPDAQRAQVIDWFAQDGVDSCLQRITSELGITTSQTSLYEALAYWRAQARFSKFQSLAMAQADLESEARGGMSADQMQEAVDRNFIMLAAETEDTELYKELRLLRIRDQESKSTGRIAEAKLKQGAAKIAQKDRDLSLAERRVAVLEKKISDAQKTLSDPSLSMPEREARMKEMFGIG